VYPFDDVSPPFPANEIKLTADVLAGPGAFDTAEEIRAGLATLVYVGQTLTAQGTSAAQLRSPQGRGAASQQDAAPALKDLAARGGDRPQEVPLAATFLLLLQMLQGVVRPEGPAPHSPEPPPEESPKAVHREAKTHKH